MLHDAVPGFPLPDFCTSASVIRAFVDGLDSVHRLHTQMLTLNCLHTQDASPIAHRWLSLGLSSAHRVDDSLPIEESGKTAAIADDHDAAMAHATCGGACGADLTTNFPPPLLPRFFRISLARLLGEMR